jgi:TolB protein
MSPAAVQLERNGDLFTLRVARENDSFQSVGSVTVALSDPVYVGLGVCSHDVDTVATALFSNLSFVSEGVVSARDRVLESSLETISIETGERRLVYSTGTTLRRPIGHVTESFSSLIARAGFIPCRRREACRKS